MADRVTIPSLIDRKRAGKRITMVTAYDALQAALVDDAGIDAILVGDSAANVVHGHETTLPVGMEEMLFHTRAAARGRKRALLVGDMPFLSYQTSIQDAVRNAGRFLKEGLADAVKLEGGADWADTVRAIVRAGIPVMGHLGLTPQSVKIFGGYKVQGRSADAAEEILVGARALEAAGAFAIVLECVPSEVARLVTRALSIPTIGIGAGAGCDGQVLVFHDLLGLSRREKRLPRFVKRYEDLGNKALKALEAFKREVEDGVFPGPEHGYEMEPGEREKLAAGGGNGATSTSTEGATPVDESVEPYPQAAGERSS